MNTLTETGQPAGVIPSIDLKVSFHGTIVLFRPLTGTATEWLDTHCPAGDEHQYFGQALAVERRYAEDLLAHAQADGLSTKGGI